MASPGAVAVLEAPDSFVLEGRPDMPGRLAYAGKVHLFGGHAKLGESPLETITRELGEEIDLYPDTPPVLLWSGTTNSEDRTGQRVRRRVSLFHVAISSAAELTLNIPGTIVEIPKTIAELRAHQAELTSFAFHSLRKVMTGERWV